MATKATAAAPKRRRVVEEDAPPPKPLELQSAAERLIAEQDAASEMIIANVPKAFNLTRDGHVHKRYEAGAQRMPRIDAEHWFSKNQGVTIVPGGSDGSTAH